MNIKSLPGDDGPVSITIVRREIVAVLTDLPEFCFIRNNVTGEPIIVKRGHKGYYPTNARANVEELNGVRGLTAAQLAAMRCGSIMGFDIPGADPLNYPELANACEYNAALIARWALKEAMTHTNASVTEKDND